MANNVEFDYVLQREGLDYLKNLIESVKVYMLAGIKLSHQGKVKPEDFWQNLFIKEGTGWNGKEGKPGDDKPIMMPSWDKKAEKIPADPYLALDFQATNKYLYYGGDRILSWNGTRANFAQDNYLFFEYFNINPVVKRNGFGPKKPKNGYERVLKDCISMRNFGAHEDLETLDEINPEALSKKIALLKSLTEDLERKKGWESKCPILTDRGFPTVKQFWEEQDRTYNQKFGAPPLDLEEMKCLLFETTEFTEAQNAAMDSALEEYQVTVKNGKIYHQPSQKELTRKLRRSTAICELMGPPQEIIQKLPVPKPVVAVTRPPVKKTAAGILQRAGFFLNGNREVMNALADGFTVLVDETIFLAAEGRVLLEKQLMPTLRERKAKLFVDESVIATLFRQFRRSVPYTELELAEIEPELREELQDIRRETHKNCKAAIKAVSTLRQQRCLEVVESLTESEHSYDNIFQVAQDNPQSRFFVLSLDGQLAEELQSVTGQNAVAAKPTLDQRLLVYKSSRKTYQALLDESAPQAAPRQVIPSEPQVNLAGSRVVAEWPDGSRQELRLGKSMGEGGEGAIYNTSAPGNAVAKIYHRRQQTQARREKLTHMIQSNPNIFGLCWPQALVYSTKGEWLGFLMPRAEGRELALTVYHPGRNNSTLMKLGWTRKSLALIAANIAAAFAKMHEKGILMGDVNPRNFMVAEDCSVFLVDCDSYQFDGFPCPVGTPLYTSPEIHRQMKAENRQEFSYTRTIEHEKYSMAILLFEVLMLGKAPYESRNTDNEDVIQAIMSGTFPYPYKGDEEEENNNARVLAPVGRWRQIWSHLTYLVKTGFYETFTGKGRLSAAEWENTLREYVRQIEIGHSSDDLVPTGYKDTSDRGGGEMVDLICTFPGCKAHFNMGREVYLRRRERGEPDRCPVHQDIRKNFSRRMVEQPCGVCGTVFQLTALEWTDRSQAGKALLCPSCVNETVICSGCRKTYTEKRDKVTELRKKGTPLLCPECLPTVVCEECGDKFRTNREKVESLRRSGRQVLCKSCLDKMLAARNAE